jgi:hypothetical protein
MARENESPRRTTRVVRRVFAMGGGGFSMEQPEEPHFGHLDRCFFSLARRKRPRVLFVPTASGDAEGYLGRVLGQRVKTSRFWLSGCEDAL